MNSFDRHVDSCIICVTCSQNETKKRLLMYMSNNKGPKTDTCTKLIRRCSKLLKDKSTLVTFSVA